ncbi:MAG: hypothetical protein P4K94_06990 [Terracidiphilus sp.]|jgi:hypothetical protein|nr:hypothetical protein [Terracidiphilus sp.]MDR3797827.1 hypothetical protein [Terracidiphilus sp.]
MWRKFLITAMVLVGALSPAAARNKHPHYLFTLPDGFIGWIQVVFNDPQAAELPWNGDGCDMRIPESGVLRTSSLRVHHFAADEFYYRISDADRKTKLLPVPSGYVLSGDSDGGFGVMDTGGKGKGYSWFIFIGPPEIRARIPLADWGKVVEEYARTHNGSKRVEAPDAYPTPGRMAPPALPAR